jgi:hypothetical protein
VLQQLLLQMIHREAFRCLMQLQLLLLF